LGIVQATDAKGEVSLGIMGCACFQGLAHGGLGVGIE